MAQRNTGIRLQGSCLVGRAAFHSHGKSLSKRPPVAQHWPAHPPSPARLQRHRGALATPFLTDSRPSGRKAEAVAASISEPPGHRPDRKHFSNGLSRRTGLAALLCGQRAAACLQADGTSKDPGHTLNRAWRVGRKKTKMAAARRSGGKKGHITSGETRNCAHTHTCEAQDVEEGREHTWGRAQRRVNPSGPGDRWQEGLTVHPPGRLQAPPATLGDVLVGCILEQSKK